RHELFEGGVDGGGGDHEPHDARPLEPLDEFAERSAPDRSLAGERANRVGGDVVDHAGEPAPQPAPGHVGDHPPDTDQANLRRVILTWSSFTTIQDLCRSHAGTGKLALRKNALRQSFHSGATAESSAKVTTARPSRLPTGLQTRGRRWRGSCLR